MQKRNVLNSPRLTELKKSRRREFENKILVCLLAIVVIGGFGSYVSRFSVLNISQVEVSGNNVVETKAVQEVVNKELSGNYLRLFPKTNILIYPASRIKDALEQNFTRFQSIKLSVKKDKILQIDVVERAPKYIWCGTNIPDTSNTTPEKCYFMDDSGYIFDTAPFFSGDIYFKFYGKTTAASDDPEGSSFEPDIFKKLIQLKATLESMAIKPISVNINTDDDVEMYLSPQKSVNATHPKIIFNKDADFQTIAENLDSVLSTDPLKSDFKNKYSSLEYIDLRYGNKVYYKFK